VISDMDNATRLGVANAFAGQNGLLPDMRIGEWHLGRALRRRIPDGMAADSASPAMQRFGPAFYAPARWRAFVDAVEHEHRAETHGAAHRAAGLDRRPRPAHRAPVSHARPKRPNSTSPIEAPLAEVKRRLENRAGVSRTPPA
jgi:hypothetical protein